MRVFLFLILQVILTLQHRVSVYYGNWKAYERAYPLCDIPFEKIDRLYYIFTDPTNGSCKFADPDLDLNHLGPIDGICSSRLQPNSDPLKGNMYQLKVIKQRYKHLKVFFVIGGYGYTTSMHDYVMTNDTAKMQAYVQTCVQMYQNYSDSFDGVDIDYEYPCLYNDSNCGTITPAFNEKELFVNFIQEFKKQLGPSVLISLASSSEYVKIDALDFHKLDSIVDVYNVMTYDFTGGSQGDAYTGHHAQPKVNHDDPVYARKFLSAELASKYYVKSGANTSKINIGVAFYGRGFLITNANKSAGPFLPSAGAITVGTSDIGSIDYYDIKKNYMILNSTNFSNVYFDDESKAPYIINENLSMFITYDNEQSIQEKVNIVEANGYDGLFAYELTGDDGNNSLLNAMWRNATINATNYSYNVIVHIAQILLILMVSLIINI